jgi:hypothetical protein
MNNDQEFVYRHRIFDPSQPMSVPGAKLGVVEPPHQAKQDGENTSKNLETTWNNHEETGGRFMLFPEFGHAFCILIDSLRSVLQVVKSKQEAIAE